VAILCECKGINLHSKLAQRDHLKMNHSGGSKAHRRYWKWAETVWNQSL